jgi:hypothetical protein
VQLQALASGFTSALDHAEVPQCADFLVAGSDDNSDSNVASVYGTLMDTIYRILPLPAGTGAQTVDSTSVFINSNGAFFNAGANPDGTVGATLAGQVAVTFGSLSAFQGFLLLHELGHQTGLFGDDSDPAVNLAYSMWVLNNCFTEDAQGVYN